MKNKWVGGFAAAAVTVVLLAGCTAHDGAKPGGSPAAGSTPTPTVAARPLATGVTPASGSLVGGEKATIAGTGLTGVTKVTFNGTEATDVTVVSPSKVTAVVPRAVNYQPSSGGVALYRGSAVVASAKSMTYTWKTVTGVDKEMQYAFAHWNAPTYNTAYYNFDAVGGDCQNFVSQSLLARGLQQNAGWSYTSEGVHSESWGYAPAFDSYLAATPSLGFTKLTSAQRDQVGVGDIAYFDWNHNGVPDHVMLVSAVTKTDGATKISLVGHNLDYDYRDLDTTITKDHPGADVWFWKVPASL